MRFIPLEFLSKWFESNMGQRTKFNPDDYNFEKETGLDREFILNTIKSSYNDVYQPYLIEAVIEKGVMLEFTQKYLANVSSERPIRKLM